MRIPDNLQNQPTASTKVSSGWHSVQFYDAKKFPAPSIAGFFCAGFEKDESAVLIATKEHTRQVKHHLERSDADVECLEQKQLLVCFDAQETLGELCRSGMMDTSALESVLRDTIAQARRRSPTGTIRIFGELVDLLAMGQDYLNCIQLERLWHRLVEAHGFRLFCAYSLESIGSNPAPGFIGGVCDAHHEILPILAKASSDGYQALVRAMLLAADCKTQAKQTADSTLLAFQSKYPGLFVVADGLADPEVAKKRRLTSRAKQIGSAIRFPADTASIHIARQEILEASARAEVDRKSAPNEGLEWHKRTGEILAHQRLIGILLELERRSDAHRAAKLPPRTQA